VPYTIAPLTDDHAEAAYRLGAVTFGYMEQPYTPGQLPPGRHVWGAFDDAGRLVGKAVDREQSHWFGGRLVPGCGIAGVVVAPEHRGHGLSTELLTRLMRHARERGAMIGALFDTTPWPYRRLGWEEAGAMRTVAVPAATLAGLRIPDGYAVRAATEADVPAILELFRASARAGCAVMDRSEPTLDTTPSAVLGNHHGVTVVTGPDGAVAGFSAWDREGGYHANGTLTVDDLIGTGPEAITALLSQLGGWAAVAPTILLAAPATDPALLVSALNHAPVRSREPFMLRLLDAPAAIAARGWNPHVAGTVDLAVEDPACPWNGGRFRFVTEHGEARLEPGGGGTVEVGPRALAMLYAGARTPDVLRRAGLLRGGDAGTDALLTAVAAGPAPMLQNYF